MSSFFIFIIFMMNAVFALEAPSLSVYQKNKKALEALQKKEVGKAKEYLSEAQLENSSLPELSYNQAEIHAAEGETKKAGDVFLKAGEEARNSKKNEVSALSYFNAGVVYGSDKNKKKDAIESYLNAIELSKLAQNEELLNKARKNLQILMDPKNKNSGGGGSNQDQKEKDPKEKDQKEDQKKEDSKENNSGKNESDSQNKENEKNKDSKDDKDEKGKKEKPEEYKGVNQKKKFKSESLTEEAADQVMNELSEKEKALQEKLKRQKGRPQSLEKDW